MSKRDDIMRAFNASITKFPDKEGEIKEAMNFFSGMITAYDNVTMNITGESMTLPPVSLN